MTFIFKKLGKFTLQKIIKQKTLEENCFLMAS
jgi:hypothetical protein